ncbi:MAG: sigma-54-dependent Fis family transcriptional regulator [Blastocatellia bacterium]|nr:sigma-54-dependent Fis family transcriptional regulator [Blastocatellia bacterium]
MVENIWCTFHGQAVNAAKATILNALTENQVAVYQTDLSSAQGSGIVFFSEVNPDFYQKLYEVSNRGLERVLCITLSQADLAKFDVWKLLRHGASDLFAWDHSSNPAKEVATKFAHWQEVDRLLKSPLVKRNLAGQSPVWVRTLRQVIEASCFTDLSILVTGESGTGKELIAQLIHTLDPRPNKRNLVISDCTTIVAELSGSEFFGHERGAFTGAVNSRDGAFALANNGTLFLDEVGELPLNLQVELLRVVQEHTYKRVGSNVWQKTDFRLICATNRDLLQEQARGRFRHDFYYRIAGWSCHLPPLRERTEDIVPLVHHFIEKIRPGSALEIDGAVRDYLVSRQYLGNVRELKQLVARILHRHIGTGPITIGDIAEEDRPSGEIEVVDWRDDHFESAIRRAVSLGNGLKEIGHAAEAVAERIVLEEEQGNIRRAASKLGITERALQMRRAAKRQGGGSIEVE